MDNNSELKPKRQGFRQRHPVLFIFGILFGAMALSVGAMALFASRSPDSTSVAFSFFRRGESIGVARLEGTIQSSADMITFLRQLREDANVKGVLLRVDSGGGGFGPSQEIFRAVKKLASVKPVVASFGGVAASGGYYAACPARVIFALPGSITASIGVRSMYPDLHDAAGRLGIGFNSFTTGKLKDSGSSFREMTPEDRAYLRGMLDDLRDIFVADVAQARHLSPEKLIGLQGKAMTAANALTIGLVDKMGSEEDALEEVKKLAGVTRRNPPLITGPKKKASGFEEIFGQLGAAFARGVISAWPGPEPRAE